MALYSRRILQRLVLENASFMTQAQRQRHVDAINRGGIASLASEWEIAVLNALSQLASIEHEPDGQKRRLDVEAFRTGTRVPLFVADIATVYETGRKQANPADKLNELIVAAARKVQLEPNRLRIRVNGALEGSEHNRVMRLALPPRADLYGFVRDEIVPFLRQCARSPSARREFEIVNANASIVLVYDPANRFYGGHYPDYMGLYSIRRNPVHNILKRKVRQLSGRNVENPAGVILCAADGDVSDRAMGKFDVPSVIEAMFRENRSLSFVATLWATDPWAGHPGEVLSRIYRNHFSVNPLSSEGAHLLASFPKRMPPTLKSGINALHELDARWRKGKYIRGSWSMSEDEIRISARSLLELLAGRITLDEFLDWHGRDRGWVPPFEQKLRRGQLLDGIAVEHVPDRDDDRVVFHFGKPDPAVAPLRASLDSPRTKGKASGPSSGDRKVED